MVAISAGSEASSISLIGFGLDSTVEVMSAVVIVWQLQSPNESRERTALKLIAISFYLLASYVAVQAVLDLTGGIETDTSFIGIGLATASLIVMPALAVAKRKTGRQLGSSAVVAVGMASLATIAASDHVDQKSSSQSKSLYRLTIYHIMI